MSARKHPRAKGELHPVVPMHPNGDARPSAGPVPVAGGPDEEWRTPSVVQQVADITQSCSFPLALLRVLQVSSDERADKHTLARAVEADPDLAKRVVSVARGPLYLTYADRIDHCGLEIRNVPNAIMKIGFAGVRNIAFTQSICVLAHEGHELSNEIAAHSIAVAEIARTLGRQKHAAIGEDAYLCGLLHDYGKLALLRALGAEYLHVATWCKRQGLATVAAERDIITPAQPHLRDHAHSGAEILRLQGLPDAVVSCTRRHHEEALSHIDGWNSWSLTGIVIAADRLAYLAGFHDGLAAFPPDARRTAEFFGLLGRTQEDLDALLAPALALARETMAQAHLPAATRAARPGQVAAHAAASAAAPAGDETSSPLAGPGVMGRIGELHRSAPPDVRTLPKVPQPLDPEYRACLALIEFARAHGRFTITRASTALALDEPGTMRLIGRFLERGYLALAGKESTLLRGSTLGPTPALMNETPETILASLSAQGHGREKAA